MIFSNFLGQRLRNHVLPGYCTALKGGAPFKCQLVIIFGHPRIFCAAKGLLKTYKLPLENHRLWAGLWPPKNCLFLTERLPKNLPKTAMLLPCGISMPTVDFCIDIIIQYFRRPEAAPGSFGRPKASPMYNVHLC